ncbi:MAG: hypothetical protein ACOCP4_00910 [Candidatus Woesearchaeota archaeon]
MLMLTQIEFEQKSGDIRRANIVCENQEDAITFIRNLPTTKKVNTINNVGAGNQIHVFTDQALNYIFSRASDTKNENINVDETTNYICPWCDKTFEKPLGLKMHIQKTHLKKKE